MNEGKNSVTPDNSVEALRVILEDEQARAVEYEEADEIGSSLLELFQILAEDSV